MEDKSRFTKAEKIRVTLIVLMFAGWVLALYLY